MPAPTALPLSDAERAELTRRASAGRGAAALRARIVLLAADGLPAVRIADRLGVARQTVAAWTARYRAGGTAGLEDRPRPGRPRAAHRRADARSTADADPDAGGAAGVRRRPSFTESRVIEAIRLAGALGRVEIAERTGLTPQSVSRIVRRLLETGLVVEAARRSGPRAAGKPRTPLRLRADAGHAVGLHIDPDVVTGVLTDLEGRVLHRVREEVSRDQPSAAVVDTAVRGAVALLRAAERPEAGRAGGPVLGVGVAVPGPIDRVAGTVFDPPLLRAWREVPVRELLAQRLGLPVVMEKDATAAAVGEHWLGKAARACDFAYLYLGAGVGAGLFLGGDVHRGLTANAGEFGRMVPDPPPGRPPMPLPRQLADGALALVDLLDLGLVVLGGPGLRPEAADGYLATVARELNGRGVARKVRRVRVERSVIEHEAAAVGAASSVFHAAFGPPPSGRAAPGR